MLKYILSSLLSCMLFASIAQDFPNLTGANKVTTVAYWKKNDTRRYHVVKTESEFRDDKKKPEEEVTVEYDLSIKVLDEQDSSYTMELIYSNFKFPSAKKHNEVLEAFQSMSEGLKVIYLTDELGIYDSIVNKEELAEKLNDQLDEIAGLFSSIMEKEDQKLLLNSLIEHYKFVFSDPSNIDVLYAEDIIRIHGYYGIEMVVAKPLEIEMVYPALNNFILLGTGTITLNDINKSARTFTFIATEEPNEDEIKMYLKSIFDVFTMGMAKEKVDLSEFDFSTKTKNRFTLELATGWLVKSSHTSTTTYKVGKKLIKKITKTTISS